MKFTFTIFGVIGAVAFSILSDSILAQNGKDVTLPDILATYRNRFGIFSSSDNAAESKFDYIYNVAEFDDEEGKLPDLFVGMGFALKDNVWSGIFHVEEVKDGKIIKTGDISLAHSDVISLLKIIDSSEIFNLDSVQRRRFTAEYGATLMASERRSSGVRSVIRSTGNSRPAYYFSSGIRDWVLDRLKK